MSFGGLTRFGFGARCRSRLSLGCLGCLAFGLVAFHPFALETPLFPGGSDRRPLRLPRQSGRFVSSACRTKGTQESGLCFRSRATAIGEVIVSGEF